MAKLEIIYKTEKDGWTHEDDTELAMNVYNGDSTLYIGMKETRTLKEMVKGVEKKLKRRTLLGQDEELEINNFDKYIIEFEQKQKRKVNSTVYNFYRMGCKAVEEGKVTLEHLIEILEESRGSKCM